MRKAQEVLALQHNHIIYCGISHYCTTPATKKSCKYMTDNDAQNEKNAPSLCWAANSGWLVRHRTCPLHQLIDEHHHHCCHLHHTISISRFSHLAYPVEMVAYFSVLEVLHVHGVHK